MEWLDAFRAHAVALPNLAKFAIVMAMIAGAPALARRFRVPQLVGLLAFGVLIGPYVLDVAPVNHPIVQFFGDLGRLLLMFTAGLEIEIDLFRKAQARSVIFGIVTTIIPQLLGTAYGLAFGYGIIPAIVIGSLLASHTLLAALWCPRIGACRRHDWRDFGIGYVVADRIRDLRFRLHDRLFAIRSRAADYRGRHLCAVGPDRRKPCRRLGSEQAAR